jgi:hypothetical protein
MLSLIQSVPQYIWLMLLVFLFGALSYLHTKKSLNEKQEDWKNVETFEPVLGASLASYITTPLYRFLRLVGVDLLSTHGIFLMLSSWLVYQTVSNVELLKIAWFIPTALIAVWFLACINFAMPDYRGKAVDSVVNVINALADRIRGSIGQPGETK